MKVRLHSQAHEWRVRDDDNVLHIFRAEWDSRSWIFTATTKKDTEWHDVENPDISHYEGLRDVLFRKYQRRRLPWKFVVELDALIEQKKQELPAPKSVPLSDDDDE